MSTPVRDHRELAPLWDLLDGFFHDIRSPLATARIGLELLREGGPLAEERRDVLLDGVSSGVQRIAEVVQTVETYRRLALMERVADVEDVELSALVADAVLERDTSGRELAVALQPASLVGEPFLIRAAVDALIDNACTHTPLGTRVQISLVPDDGGGTVVVADDGPGVPDDVKNSVFEPFARGRTPRSVMGLGIGLALVAEVARLHGGRVAVEDSAGGGATFRLSLASVTAAPPAVRPARPS